MRGAAPPVTTAPEHWHYFRDALPPDGAAIVFEWDHTLYDGRFRNGQVAFRFGSRPVRRRSWRKLALHRWLLAGEPYGTSSDTPATSPPAAIPPGIWLGICQAVSSQDSLSRLSHQAWQLARPRLRELAARDPDAVRSLLLATRGHQEYWCLCHDFAVVSDSYPENPPPDEPELLANLQAIDVFDAQLVATNRRAEALCRWLETTADPEQLAALATLVEGRLGTVALTIRGKSRS